METAFLTSFQVPRLRSDHIQRPRLQEKLRNPGGQRLIIVAAPAAYGKTTLLSQFAHESQRPLAWYSADPSEADLKTFFHRVFASLASVFPELTSPPELDSSEAPATLGNTLVVRLVNQLHLQRGGGVLIWDNFHHLNANPEIIAAVDSFVAHMPDDFTLILGTRVIPSLPSLQRFLGYREATLILPQELCLTEEETALLLSTIRGREVPSELVKQLQEKAQGWMGGILALELNPEHPELDDAASEEVLRYFAESSLTPIPEQQRWFFRLTSLLPHLSVEACNSVLRITDSEGFLHNAYSKTGFLSRIDGPSPVYKWHDLIREGLEKQFRLEDPGAYAYMAKATALYCRETGSFEQAISLFFKTGDFEEVALLLLLKGDAYIRAGKWRLLESWLTQLPEQTQEEQPQLLELRGRLATRLGEKEQAVAYFNRAIASATERQDDKLQARLLITRSAAFRLMGYEAEAEADARAAVQLLEDAKGCQSDLIRALRQLATIHVYKGKYEEAEQWFRKALELLRSHPDEYESALLNGAAGWAYLELGRMGLAQSHLEKAAHVWKRTGNQAQLAVSLNNLALLWHRQGDLEKARELLNEALRHAQESAYTRFEAIIQVSLGDVERDCGELDAALEWYEKGLALAGQVVEANLISYTTAVVGDTYRLKGEMARAEVFLDQAKSLASSQQQSYESALASMYSGLLAASRGDLQTGKAHLQEAGAILEENTNAHARALLSLYNAEVAFFARDIKGAKAHLEGLCKECTEMGYWGFLKAEALRAPALFAWAATTIIGDGFFHQFAGAPGSADRGQLASSPAGRLSLSVRAYGFGTPRVYLGNELIGSNVWESPRATELFFYLLAKEGPVSRDQVIVDLWPETSPTAGYNNFHTSIRRVRNAIHPSAVIFESGGYAINPDLDIWFDLQEFFNKVRAADHMPAGTRERADALEEALSLCSGTLFEDFYSEWAEALKRKADTLYLSALSNLSGFYTAQKDFSRALQFLERAASYNQLEETVVMETIRCYIAKGDGVAAMKTYEQYRETLETELDAEPAPALQSLRKEAMRLLVR
ncbi:MAG: tetratricopeptide repeat protein [Chloroflexi bacterium]|nr:tetratricopeptide repeat protein [Chloroflexota bacterium]